jgi:hypothetical protein
VEQRATTAAAEHTRKKKETPDSLFLFFLKGLFSPESFFPNSLIKIGDHSVPPYRGMLYTAVPHQVTEKSAGDVP